MAGVTLSKSAAGTRRLLFFDLHDRRRRHQIGLGAMPKAEAESMRSRVEKLRASRLANTSPPDAVNEWLASLPDEWHAKLATAGLVEKRVTGRRVMPTLSELVDLFKAQAQWLENSEGTRGTYERTFRHMLRRFGAARAIDEITVGHAKDFRPFLQNKKPDGCGLAISTASATITQVKTLFEMAVDYGHLSSNPFRKIRTPQHEAQKAFVTVEMARKVSRALPDDEWRLAFALARWCGLRVISELREMVWSHVDFANRELKVISPKTRRHPHGSSRVVPLFDEVFPLMQQRFDEAEEGDLYVLPNVRRCKAAARRVVIAAIEDAGYEPWAELFNSLRSTRETELLQQGVSLSEVAEVIGHSVRVAEKNYVQQMGRDRRQAMLARTRTNSAQTFADSTSPEATSEIESSSESESAGELTRTEATLPETGAEIR